MNWLIKNKVTICLLLLGTVFFVIYSWFFFSTTIDTVSSSGQHYIFSWPDAMSNNFFIHEYIEKNNFYKSEALNLQLGNIIHPRSTNVAAGGKIVPMSFLGMLIIYGWIGKFIGKFFVMFLTPFLAAAGAVFFFGLVKRIFNQTVAFISSILLFTLASYWYYANLVMLPTILFVFLVICGMYFFVRQTEPDEKWRRAVFSGASGLLLGLAAITRSTEVFWLAALIVIPLIYYWRRVKFYQVIIFLICLLIPLAILLYYNQQIYGNYFTVGYLKINESRGMLNRLPDELAVNKGSQLFAYAKLLIAPFGFNKLSVWLNVKKYFIDFSWPYFLLFAIGAAAWVNKARQKLAQRQLVYVICSIVAGTWLIVYYGSWEFTDELVLRNNTIGSSYTRYWLPLTILILPMIGYLFDQLLKFKEYKKIFISAIVFFILGLSVFSFNQVYQTVGDGLFDQQKVIGKYQEQASGVARLIEPDAIVINDRADKIFFPNYRVVMFNLDYSIFEKIKPVVGQVPIYYFTERPEIDINYINEKKINSLNLRLDNPQTIDPQFQLYKLSQIK